MFEEWRLLGDTERSIVVETRTGRRIENLIECEPGERELRIFEKIKESFREPPIIRKGPAGVYNCAGHVWASRRASLLNAASWRDILEDDDYRPASWRVTAKEPIHAGDLALYIDRNADEIIHVAEVVQLQQRGNVQRPWVLSKLNSAQGEVIHAIDDVGFLNRMFRVRTEIWTDRPSDRPDVGAFVESSV